MKKKREREADRKRDSERERHQSVQAINYVRDHNDSI